MSSGPPSGFFAQQGWPDYQLGQKVVWSENTSQIIREHSGEGPFEIKGLDTEDRICSCGQGETAHRSAHDAKCKCFFLHPVRLMIETNMGPEHFNAAMFELA